MGDTYIIPSLTCAYCGKSNLHKDDKSMYSDGICYAPSSGVDTFKCEHCGKENRIVHDFVARKMQNEDKPKDK